MKNCFLSIVVCTLIVSAAMAEPMVVESPNGKVSATVEISKGELFYSVQYAKDQIVDKSSVSIFADSKISMIKSSVSDGDSTWVPTYGQFSKIRDHYQELALELKSGDIPVTFLFRAYDSGVGFRFVMSEESKDKKMVFSNGYNILGTTANYSGQRGTGPVQLGTGGISYPLVSELKSGKYAAFIESDLYSASPFECMRSRNNASKKMVEASSTAVSSGAGQVTPWRVVLVGETAGDLLVSTVTLNLAAPCKIKDTSWIKAGKGLWDWRVHGYDNGDFAYDINTKSYIRYIDFCSENGIEYFTVDDHWFKTAGEGKMTVAPEVDIEKVMSYAKEKGVDIMLYYDRKKGNFGDETLFSHYAALGATGMKYGFMGNKAGFTRDAINSAAENKLVINFHDGPVPMTGVERTMPNLISREFCHGQQDSRSAFTPETFIKMALVSALTGPLDMSNGNFGLKSINAGERQKGPRKLNSYISTVVSEVARNIIIYSGLVTLPDAPEEYNKKADLFECLAAMPATWDDTLVPHSKIGEFITVARRTGDVWFVGSVNDQKAKSLDIKLDFLDKKVSYEATIYQDAPDTHGVTNSETYEIKTQTVKRGDVISAKMAVGGGHAMILRPKK